MKRMTAAISLLALLAAAVLLWRHYRAAEIVSSGRIALVGVESLMNHSGDYSGKVQVKGFVGQIASEKKLFSLVDESDIDEFMKKGSISCVTLPVRWSGTTPHVEEHLKVLGQIGKDGEKLVFVATAVQTLGHAASQENK